MRTKGCMIYGVGFAKRSAASEKISLLEEQTKNRHAFQRLVGKSAPMQEVFRRLRLASQIDVTVLITGESGTGKELAAQAIHALSARHDKPFLSINCGALPETLLLFIPDAK